MLFVLLRPAPFRALFSAPGLRLWPLGLNLVGVALTLVPLSFMQNGGGTASILPAFAFWSLGMGLLLVGLALYAAPLSHWRAFRNNTWRIPAAAAAR